MSIKEKSDVQEFLYQFNIYCQGNSRPRKGAQRRPKVSKCIPKAFNVTPTSDQYNHNHVTTMDPQYHNKNTHEEPNKDNLPNT